MWGNITRWKVSLIKTQNNERNYNLTFTSSNWSIVYNNAIPNYNIVFHKLKFKT